MQTIAFKKAECYGLSPSFLNMFVFALCEIFNYFFVAVGKNAVILLSNKINGKCDVSPSRLRRFFIYSLS